MICAIQEGHIIIDVPYLHPKQFRFIQSVDYKAYQAYNVNGVKFTVNGKVFRAKSRSNRQYFYLSEHRLKCEEPNLKKKLKKLAHDQVQLKSGTCIIKSD